MDDKAVSQPQSQHQAELHATTLLRASTLAHATVELGGNAVVRDRLLRAHFFKPVSQFSTTVTGGEGSPTSAFTIRNLLPSRVASYR
jgi:hypothetical protein